MTIFYALFQIENLSNFTQKLYDHPYTVSNAVREIDFHIVSMHRSMKDVALAENMQEIKLAVDKVNIHEKKVYKLFDTLEERFLGSKEKVFTAKKSFTGWKQIRDEVIALMKAGKQREAAKITKEKGAFYIEGMYEKISYLKTFATNKGRDFFEKTKVIENKAFQTVLISAIVSLLLTIFISLYMTFHIKSRLKVFGDGLQSFFSYLNGDTKEIVYLEESYHDEFGTMAKVVNQSIERTTKKIAEEERVKSLVQHQSKLAAMGEMVGAIAHQWRQPLNEIAIHIQKIKRDFRKNKIDEIYLDDFIKKNMNTIEFMSSTIDNFRNFFRVDKNTTNFDVKDAVEDVVNMLLAQIDSHNIKLITELESCHIKGYNRELQQALMNLISNAKDALIENNIQEPYIKISLKGNELMIEDNGGGIPKSTLEHIFEPYFTTKEEGKGTGMGLYMTKMILEENMDGLVTVDTYKEGTRFTITLPKGREQC